MKYPDLPASARGVAGPIAVKLRTEKVMAGDKEVWGSWDESTRIIEIDTRVAKAHQWRVYFHEMMHATLADTGIESMFTDGMVETICDATATARMRERFG